MTESEVLKIFENEVIILDCWIEHCKDIIADCETEEDEFDDDKERAELSLRDYTERKEAFDVAISALKEIHLYKNNKLCLIPEDVYSRQCSELDAYKEIGTVEECREAVEKLSAKIVSDLDYDLGYLVADRIFKYMIENPEIRKRIDTAIDKAEESIVATVVKNRGAGEQDE